jgi:hypothetical protein
MALVKYNNNSISDITTPGSLAQGKMILISEQTASGSASISFTSGIDSTYPIYCFEFINIHPATDDVSFQFNLSTDGGSNYNVTKTSTAFLALHTEADDATLLVYSSGEDLAQSTSFQNISPRVGNVSDESCSGTLKIFNPSSSVFVKHFIANMNRYYAVDPSSVNDFTAGYGNTTSAVDAVRFQMSSGNIDSGNN